MLRPGDRLGDRYEVIEQIASGGMGTLWRAHHLELDVDVALKVVSTRATTPGSFKRFKREAQAAAKLRSPNIVQVLDYGEFDGQPYLAMELLRGEDLAARLARVGKISCDGCLKIIEGVAKAAQLAHDADIVHRDLKPANVFLERVGEEEIVKVLDFGVAKDLSAAPEPGSTTAVGVVGSPPYMSPEQVWGQAVGHRADVWAMGVLAFEMLTGENPFYNETLAKVFERIVRDPLPKVRELEPDLPPELELFFERALARAPNQRFGSATELARALRAAIQGQTPSEPDADTHAATREVPIGRPARTTQRLPGREIAGRPKRRLRPLWIGAAVILTAGFGLVSLTKKSHHNPTNRTPEGGTPGQPDAARSAPSALSGASSTSTDSRASAALAAPAPSIGSLGSPSSPHPGPSSSRASLRPKAVSSPSQGSPKLDPKFGIPLGQ